MYVREGCYPSACWGEGQVLRQWLERHVLRSTQPAHNSKWQDPEKSQRPLLSNSAGTLGQLPDISFARDFPLQLSQQAGYGGISIIIELRQEHSKFILCYIGRNEITKKDPTPSRSNKTTCPSKDGTQCKPTVTGRECCRWRQRRG